ncbi:substrate-binding protein [Bradyrhizobium sp. Gha]|nr:substrate-binding protein [Bradyrhizobium sp. Gha]
MRGLGATLVLAVALSACGSAGAADTELVLGQTMPYSGPASALSAVGKVQTRYFQMINDRGGINGHKVKLISLDDGYSPPKAVEQTRRLIENDEAVAIFGSMGTAQNAAVQKYLNAKKIPQLFVFAASERFADPKTSPYTISGMTLFSTEAAIYARLVAEHTPGARVAVLYQNDDYGREYLRSFKAELARLDPKAEIVATSPYEVTSPTVDSQVVALASTKATSSSMRPPANLPRRRSAKRASSAGARSSSCRSAATSCRRSSSRPGSTTPRERSLRRQPNRSAIPNGPTIRPIWNGWRS